MNPVLKIYRGLIPEINPQKIKEHKGIIANPNCTTIIGIVPVWPLHKANPVKRMVVSSYQAASGAGAQAMAEKPQQVSQFIFRLSLENFIHIPL